MKPNIKKLLPVVGFAAQVFSTRCFHLETRLEPWFISRQRAPCVAASILVLRVLGWFRVDSDSIFKNSDKKTRETFLLNL